MTTKRLDRLNVIEHLPKDFKTTFSLEDNSICLDEIHRKLAVLTELGEYEIIDFDLVEDCQLDIQNCKKNCKDIGRKKLDPGCCCDFYLDITLKNHPYLSDVSICLNSESIDLTSIEKKDPTINKLYSKYLKEGNKIVDKLSKEKEVTA